MKTLFLLPLILFANEIAIAGPEDFYDRTTDADKILAMKRGMEVVKRELRDPESAQFRKVYYHTTHDNLRATCGEVNAKNGFGGYSGFTRFVATNTVSSIQADEDPREFKSLWNRLCQ